MRLFNARSTSLLTDPLPRLSRGLVTLALSSLLVAAPSTYAAPLGVFGDALGEIKKNEETPAGRRFRTGFQAQLNGNLPAAEAEFLAAIKLDPKHVPSLIGLAALAHGKGQRDQTMQWLSKAEKAAPNAIQVHLAWGRLHVADREFARAERSFNAARAAAPKATAPMIELGDLYMQQRGRTAEAVNAYKSALAIDPRNALAQYGLGVALAATGNRTDATTALIRAAELSPADAAPLRALGRMHLEAGDPIEALKAFDLGLARRPDFVTLMMDRTDALGSLQRWNDAEAQLQAALKLVPKATEVHTKLGDVRQGAKRWDDAQASYLMAIELEPRNMLAYNNLAWMTIVRNGDAVKAVGWAGKAVEISPRSSPFYDTLGWAQRAAGKLKDAEASLRKAIELEPRVPGYHYHLGIIQEEQNLRRDAKQSYGRALEINASFANADDARKRMNAIPG